MRAHYSRLIQDDEGALQQEVVVAIYESGTQVLISDEIFVDDSSSSTRSNPFASIDGRVDFYLDDPKRVRLGLKRLDEEEQFYDDVDVVHAAVPTEILLQSPDGTVWALSIDDTGTVETSST